MSQQARTGKRFPLEFAARIHGGNQGSVTADMSGEGVYLRGNAALDVGSNVRFEMALPPELTGAAEKVIVECSGRVVRKDTGADAGGPGAACVIDTYDIRID